MTTLILVLFTMEINVDEVYDSKSGTIATFYIQNKDFISEFCVLKNENICQNRLKFSQSISFVHIQSSCSLVVIENKSIFEGPNMLFSKTMVIFYLKTISFVLIIE